MWDRMRRKIGDYPTKGAGNKERPWKLYLRRLGEGSVKEVFGGLSVFSGQERH